MFYLNGETHDESNAWHTRKLIPGSTFIVGDPKQSIYRFRGADITQYNLVKDIFEDDPHCEIVVLKRNYRTQSGIIDWVEKVFKLPEGCGDELKESANGSQKFLLDQRAPYQASFFGMDAQRVDNESDELEVIKGVYYFVAGDEKRIDDYRNSESIWVSGYIDRLVKEGFLIETHNIATGALERRPIRYGDFLILLYYTKGMGDYITSLKEKNIPVSYAGRLKLGNIDEIANYIDLVQYLASPRNESMLCNVLINCFGISNLEAWKKNGEERINLVDYLMKNQTEDSSESVFSALSIIKDLIALKYSMTPIAFMRRLLDEFSIIYTNRYNETLLKSISGTLHYLLEKLSAKSLVSFEIAARELNLMKDLDTDREMLLEDSGANGGSGYVRIMNLHKAKGLEAPIVILATGGKEYSHSVYSATRQTDRGREVYLKLLRGNSTIGYSSVWSSIEEEEARSLRAEALRLHYVAATRPINALVVSGRKDNNWKRYQGLVLREIPRDFPADYTKSGDLFWLDKEIVKIKKNELVNKKMELVDNASIAQYAELRPSKLKEIIEIPWTETSSRIHYAGPSGEHWGTAVHRTLELYFISCGYILAGTPNIEAVTAIIDRAIEESKKDADFSPYKDQLYQILKSFTLNPEVRRIADVARLLPELRFDLVREGDEVKEYISGIIDLLISADKGVYLMDYKTNVPRGNLDQFINQMKDTYRPQMGLYREFLENTMGKNVLGAYIYLTALDQVIEI
jgi:ATP-dependent helicase/nuclease subunit A